MHALESIYPRGMLYEIENQNGMTCPLAAVFTYSTCNRVRGGTRTGYDTVVNSQPITPDRPTSAVSCYTCQFHAVWLSNRARAAAAAAAADAAAAPPLWCRLFPLPRSPSPASPCSTAAGGKGGHDWLLTVAWVAARKGFREANAAARWACVRGFVGDGGSRRSCRRRSVPSVLEGVEGVVVEEVAEEEAVAIFPKTALQRSVGVMVAAALLSYQAIKAAVSDLVRLILSSLHTFAEHTKQPNDDADEDKTTTTTKRNHSNC